ncbi:MAG: anthranilate synthase component I family protein [Phycisphaerales bacterium]|nr:MAG: anthranilate synthase component I family protein [Phycisphaerales bacterium]
MILGTAAKSREQTACRLHYRRVRTAIDMPSLSEVFAGLRSASILGGNEAGSDAGRFSYWAAQPTRVLRLEDKHGEPFERLGKALGAYSLKETIRETLPEGIFTGGWIGFFGYELGRYVERVPRTTVDDLSMPLIRLCFYDRVICYDRAESTFILLVLQLPDDSETPQEKLDCLEQLLTRAQSARTVPPQAGDIERVDFSRIRCNMEKDCYLRAVEKVKRYIYDGEVYQVNLSQRFECDYNRRAIELFHWQNLYNPSPYAAYIDAGDFQIVSASPEMFVTIERGFIRTRPIKGTRPRFEEDSEAAVRANAANFNELLRSEKERAELNMIIDLERNDLARICKPGTRKVIQPRTIEAYRSVFHAVATVGGQLREETGLCDVLRAMFPGGSVTGAPKIRSMEIIDELEPTARGVYTGSIGFIGVDGTVCLNIAIRTVIISCRKAFVQAGGGIVADSDPQAEWQETITKARALLAGIAIVQNGRTKQYERRTGGKGGAA